MIKINFEDFQNYVKTSSLEESLNFNDLIQKVIESVVEEEDNLVKDFLWAKYEKLSSKKTFSNKEDLVAFLLKNSKKVRKAQFILCYYYPCYFTNATEYVEIFDNSGVFIEATCCENMCRRFEKDNPGKSILRITMCDDKKFKEFLNEVEGED